MGGVEESEGSHWGFECLRNDLNMNKGEQKFIRALAESSGNDFQDYVCRLIDKKVNDFQTVPAGGGDGGIDGLMDGNTTAFCVYGPERDRQSASVKELNNKFRNKMRNVLLRILELKSEGAGKSKKVSQAMNPELESVLATKKLKKIVFIFNYLEDKKILGHLTKIWNELISHSKKRFVIEECSLTIRGPKELVGKFGMDESLAFEFSNKALAEILRGIETGSVARPMERTDFDDKFDHLDVKATSEGDKETVKLLRGQFEKAWSEYLHIVNKLSRVAPTIANDIDKISEKLVLEVKLLGPGDHAKMLDIKKQIFDTLALVEKRIGESGNLEMPADEGSSMARRFVGNLIGDCTLDWRDNGN